MKKNKQKFLRIMLSLIMIFSMIPSAAIHIHAWDIYVDCEFCGAGCGDDYICSGGDHCGPDSGRDCYDAHHCQICYECSNNTDFCEDCKMCVECARDNKVHCLGCGECGMDTDLCPNCGQCYDSCGGTCSEGTDHLCYDCHVEEDAGLICEDCGTCFVEDEASKKCFICGGCLNCNGRCDADEVHACLECHLEEGMACPNCHECYVDNEQETCTDCGSCYGCVDFICEDCGRCNDCTEVCEHCEVVCIDCHESGGEVCPDCGMCGGGDPMCWECGGCSWCRWICDICGICGDCRWDYHCPECDACYLEFEQCLNGGEHCVACCEANEWLCPGCGECIEGNGYDLVCRDCGVCEGCAEFCDTCGDCCLDCLMNEQTLHCPECGICFYDTRSCHECGLCENCVELCEYCGDYCMDCAADLGYHCSDCGEVCFSSGDPYCEGCELCADCVDEYCYDCEQCVECAIDQEMHCPDCYECFWEVSACDGECGYCEECCRCAYTVSFDANGGRGTMPEVTVYGAYVLPECGFVPPSNRIFSGWKVNGVTYSVGETVIITEDTVITAAWRRKTIPATPYSISFRANGGSGTMDTVAVYGLKYVLPACEFTAPGSVGRDVMVFAGWRVNDIQGVLPAGTPIDITGDTVLTAVWTESTLNTYTVFFDANGGDGIFGPVYISAGTYTLPKCYFTAPVGKQFKAWAVDGVEYAPGKTITISSNTTVKAIWDDIYVVVFVANGGTGTMEPYAMTKGTYTLPECSFEAPAGKQFKGWMVGTREYAPGAEISVSAHVRVTAVWETISDGITVRGTVTSFGDNSAEITLQLIPDGTSTPAYEVIVKGNTTDYCFEGVKPGAYILKISKDKHVTREYKVTVAG